MEIFKHKKILLGVTGSIAAYKSPLLVRELIKADAEVRVIMTQSSKHFVSPIVLSNLTRYPVAIEMFDEKIQSGGAWHIELAHWCDLMIIAPCTAATIGKLAHGICDNSLVTVAVALPKGIPLIISPAMDTSMLVNPSTIRNINTLQSDGVIIIPPEEGELSSGLIGPGRMPESNVIMNFISDALKKNSELIQAKNDDNVPINNIGEILSKPSLTLEDAVDKDKWTAEYEYSMLIKNIRVNEKYLSGRKILITAGPTIEKIDDVRYISNFSSGKMGVAIAEAAGVAGAEVVLISGPTNLSPIVGIKTINVQSSEDMFAEVLNYFDITDIAILAAAVADYTPSIKYKGKLKKSVLGDKMILELEQTKDILAQLGILKKPHQLLIGFSLESSEEIENATKKLHEKNCDMIVLNSLNQYNSVFGSDNNTIVILRKDGIKQEFPTLSKKECADIILRIANDMLQEIKH